MSERYEKTEWDKDLEQSQSTLRGVDAGFLHLGPSFQTETKAGASLYAETQFYYYEGIDFSPCEAPGMGLRFYMFVKNEGGEIVGKRVATISRVNSRKLECKSKISVRDRGQGLASPTEECFIQVLQAIADSENAKLVWKIENRNLENLETYRATDNPDPERIARMEAEQERWQHLYGEGGKFGVSEGQRVFEPQTSSGASLAGTLAQVQEAVSDIRP